LANPGSSTTTTTTTNPGGGSSNPGGSSNAGGGGAQGPGREAEQAHRVVGGDNLWKIARDHLLRERSGGSGAPTNREVAAYWVKVVEANRDRLHSGDPDLIYPGERITLPPVD
jgi:nucleoid-associated protein YgaU